MAFSKYGGYFSPSPNAKWEIVLTDIICWLERELQLAGSHTTQGGNKLRE